MDSSKPPFDDSTITKQEGPTSATGVFGTVKPAPDPAGSSDDLLQSLRADGSANNDVPEQRPTQAPGAFTQMFQAQKAEGMPEVMSEKPATDLTSVFTPVTIPKPKPQPVTPVPSGQQPGEFTQLLKTLSTPVVQGETPSAPPDPAASQPGAFTQMFQAITAQDESASSSVPKSSEPAAPPQPGAFTQMFQTISKSEAEKVSPEESQPAAEGFTQIFQSLSSKQSPSPQSAQPANVPGSFTQMFAQANAQGSPQSNPLASLKSELSPSSDFSFTPPAQPSSIPAQGGFTKLFEALDSSKSAPKEPPPLTPPSPQPVIPPAVGGFTQLLRTLNADQVSQSQVVPPSIPSAQSASVTQPLNGPGEFTRVISGSMLREAQGQSAMPIMSTPSQAPSGQPAFQIPPPSQFPKPSPMPQMHGGAGGAAPQMPHLQPPPFTFPPAPAPQAPPASKLQQYLPLILVVNVFVLIVIVLIVIFALRHH
ncbi:MAG TPA: hypothetical protein VHB45_14130 [Alloacidobacterium sp.]|nr:hypothetical protein [Alloacidobacterium sp.]